MNEDQDHEDQDHEERTRTFAYIAKLRAAAAMEHLETSTGKLAAVHEKLVGVLLAHAVVESTVFERRLARQPMPADLGEHYMRLGNERATLREEIKRLERDCEGAYSNMFQATVASWASSEEAKPSEPPAPAFVDPDDIPDVKS